MIDPKQIFDFSIQEKECHARCFATAWTVPPQLPYFQGHFPNEPILPAVAMIDASVELLRRALGVSELVPAAVKNAKFMMPVRPNFQVLIEAHLVKDTEYAVDWKTLEPEGHSLARLILLF